MHPLRRLYLAGLVADRALIPTSGWSTHGAPSRAISYGGARRNQAGNSPRIPMTALQRSNGEDQKEEGSVIDGPRPQAEQSVASPLSIDEEIQVEGDGIDVEYNEPLWQDNVGNGPATCRICAQSDGEIPTSIDALPQSLIDSNLLTKLDALYHAESHSETRSLKYNNPNEGGVDLFDAEALLDEEEESARLMAVLRRSLENAGFELLNKRDVDLCEALNAGYLLRLSIQPDVKDLDEKLAREFHPEDFEEETDDRTTDLAGHKIFGGRVLVFRRDYSEEVSMGRLLLPKFDYLQSSIVQKSASIVTGKYARFEQRMSNQIDRGVDSIKTSVRGVLSEMVDFLPERLSLLAKSNLGSNNVASVNGTSSSLNGDSVQNRAKMLKLNRYGGSMANFVATPDLQDAINPFLVCEIDYDEDDSTERIYDDVNSGRITCEYDSENGSDDPMRLLKRVSISNLVDFFSSQGRRDIVRGYYQKARLVEPTFEEVVVVWRPAKQKPKREIAPPKALVEAAEIFGVEDWLPKRPKPELIKTPALKIRTFTDVPMANLPAVLPKTKLVFRPGDAFVFDTISILSLMAVLASLRFDSFKFDLLAIISGSFWIIRTFFRYSNKLARYDLLVNKFLTSRISHRDRGALRYLSSEAASQRAVRVGLIYTWLRKLQKMKNGGGNEVFSLTKEDVLKRGALEMNNLITCDRLVKINVEEALADLEGLGAIKFNEESKSVILLDEAGFRKALNEKWSRIL